MDKSEHILGVFMKAKGVFLLSVVICFLNSCVYINKTYIEKSSEDVQQAATNMLSKTGYKYDIVTDKDSKSSLIRFNRFMEGVGNIIVIPEKDNKTDVFITFTTGNYNDALWIFRDALIQELTIIDTGERLNSKLKKKSIKKFLLLNTLNSELGLYYNFDGNPYYSKSETNFLSAFFGLIEIPYYYYLIVKPMGITFQIRTKNAII